MHGVAIEKWNLDDLGHTLTYSYYDARQRPTLGEFGYHKVDYEWSSLGQITKSSTYGSDKKLIEDEYGTAIYDYTLQPYGLIQTIKRFNKNGILAQNSNKVVTTHYETRLNGLYFLDKELDASGEEVTKDSIAE